MISKDKQTNKQTTKMELISYLIKWKLNVGKTQKVLRLQGTRLPQWVKKKKNEKYVSES